MNTSICFLWNFDHRWSWSSSLSEIFEKKSLISCPVCHARRQLEMSFCHFSLILPLNWRFKPWNLVFRKRWSWLKLFNTIRETFWKKNNFIPCPISNIWRHLYTSYCWFSVIVVVQNDQTNILKILYILYYVSFSTYDVICDAILLFWLILPVNSCFKHLDLVFRKFGSWLMLIIFIREKFWKILFFISWPLSDLWRHLKTLFFIFI